MANVNLQRAEMFTTEGAVFGAEIAGGLLAAEGASRLLKGMLQPQGTGESVIDIGAKAGTAVGLRMLSGFVGGITSDALGVASWGAFAWAILSLIVTIFPQIGVALQRAQEASAKNSQVNRDRQTVTDQGGMSGTPA